MFTPYGNTLRFPDGRVVRRGPNGIWIDNATGAQYNQNTIRDLYYSSMYSLDIPDGGRGKRKKNTEFILDFTTMSSLSSLFTFTRGSTATFINSSGLLEEVGPATTNDPSKARLDHDLYTGTPRGLLLEGSAQNLCLNGSLQYVSSAPTSFTRSFNGCSADSVSSDVFLGKSAWRISATLGTDRRDFLTQTVNFGVTGATYTISCYIEGVSGAIGLFSYVEGDVANGAIAGSIISPTTAGRYKYNLKTGNTAFNGNVRIGIGPSGVQTIGTGGFIQFSHIQVELGHTASSYIPTTSAAVTRAAEVCYISPNTSFFNISEGTVLQETAVNFETTNGYARIFGFVDDIATPFNTTPDSITVGIGQSNNRPFLNLTENNTYRGDAFIPAGGEITKGEFFKLSTCYKQGDYRASRAAVSGSLGYTGSYPTSLPTLYFNGLAGSYLSAVWYKSFKYYPRRLSNAEMDAWSSS